MSIWSLPETLYVKSQVWSLCIGDTVHWLFLDTPEPNSQFSSKYVCISIGPETEENPSERSNPDEEELEVSLSASSPKRFKPSKPEQESYGPEESESETADFSEKFKMSSSPEELKDVQISLEGRELWDRFNELGTEMIITKSGR